MAELLTLLRSLNRKERFILLTQASSGAVPLAVSDHFREKLNKVLPDAMKVPGLAEGQYVLAMDFHLNWLVAALQMAYRNKSVGEDLDQSSFELPTELGLPPRKAFERNQEDVDLLLGWIQEGRTKLVLIEAKAHTGYQTKQLASKGARFAAIFGEDGQAYADEALDVAFVLAGFKNPQREQFLKAWDDFTRRETGTHPKQRRMVLLDTPDEVLIVGEKDATGNPLTEGGHWRVTRKTFSS